jgi:hypothetical protein
VIYLLMLQHPEHKQHRSAKEHHHELGRFAKGRDWGKPLRAEGMEGMERGGRTRGRSGEGL